MEGIVLNANAEKLNNATYSGDLETRENYDDIGTATPSIARG